MALLEVRNLQVNYGPIQAVKGIDLDVEKGVAEASELGEVHRCSLSFSHFLPL